MNQSRPGDAGLVPPGQVVELIQTLHNLYQQRDEDIRYQRGAILEVLVYLLVGSHYNANECQSNHRFVDNHGRYVTEQVDVAALSQKGKINFSACFDKKAHLYKIWVLDGTVYEDGVGHKTRREARLQISSPPSIESGREDLNLRPPQPHCGALPGCATPRSRTQEV